MQRYSSNSKRPGVSVMEVLMSIGIVSVGLLGVVAIVPVGGHQAERGFLEDSKALFGKSAFRQFELRGMGDTNNWQMFDPTNGNARSYAQVAASSTAPHGICLDPRFIARNSPASDVKAAAFPFVQPMPQSGENAPQQMHRGTLRVAGTSGPVPMGVAMADLIFQTSDDLRFQKPKDRSLPPVPWDAIGVDEGPQPWQDVDDTIGLAPAEIASRMSEGELSWLATLAPRLRSGAQQLDDMYVLSIVIFDKRELAIGGLPPETERVVRVQDMFPGGGFGGGEVNLQSATETDLINEFNDFGAGNWVMLMRREPNAAAQEQTVYRWYKVIAADDQLQEPSSGTFVRSVTLDGPDWSESNNNPTFAVIMPGVVGVYEKLVRLEGSSLFEF